MFLLVATDAEWWSVWELWVSLPRKVTPKMQPQGGAAWISLMPTPVTCIILHMSTNVLAKCVLTYGNYDTHCALLFICDTVVILFNVNYHRCINSRFQGNSQRSFLKCRVSCAILVELNVPRCCCKSCTGGSERQRKHTSFNPGLCALRYTLLIC